VSGYEGVELAYYNSLKVALEDGSIDNKEFKHLDELREQLSISMETHNQMESELRVEPTTKEKKGTKQSLGIKDSVVSKSNITNIAGDSVVQQVSGDVENYAKTMVDKLGENVVGNEKNDPWDYYTKAKEIDYDKTEELFRGKKYGKKLADGYLDQVENAVIPKMDEFWGYVSQNLNFHQDVAMEQIAILNEQIWPLAITFIGNAEHFHPDGLDYCRTQIVTAKAFFHFYLHESNPEFTEAMNNARDAINKALKIEPENKEAKEWLAKINNEKPKSNSCFIATAAYGTPFAEEIDVLRDWRDDYLAQSYLGRAFIKTYYSLSPPVANNISTSETKKKIVRITLDPIVKILKSS